MGDGVGSGVAVGRGVGDGGEVGRGVGYGGEVGRTVGTTTGCFVGEGVFPDVGVVAVLVGAFVGKDMGEFCTVGIPVEVVGSAALAPGCPRR